MRRRVAGSFSVMRGGSYGSVARSLRVTFRDEVESGGQYGYGGFRFVIRGTK